MKWVLSVILFVGIALSACKQKVKPNEVNIIMLPEQEYVSTPYEQETSDSLCPAVEYIYLEDPEEEGGKIREFSPEDGDVIEAPGL